MISLIVVDITTMTAVTGPHVGVNISIKLCGKVSTRRDAAPRRTVTDLCVSRVAEEKRQDLKGTQFNVTSNMCKLPLYCVIIL